MMLGGAGLTLYALTQWNEARKIGGGRVAVHVQPMEAQRDFWRHMSQTYQWGGVGLVMLIVSDPFSAR